MAVYTNKAKWDADDPTVRVGRQSYLDSDSSARADTAKGKTTVKHFIRIGRAAYVNGRD